MHIGTPSRDKENFMRNHAKFGRITCIVLAVLMIPGLFVAVFSSMAYADSASIKEEINDLTDEKEEIQARIEEYEAEIEGIDYEKANVLEKKAVLDQKNLLAQEEIQVIEEQITIIDGLVTNMQMDLAEAKDEEEYQRERWLTRIRAMEEGSNLSYMEVLFNATSFSDLLTRLDLVNEVIEYDRDLEEAYVAARENVEFLEAEAEVMFAENEVKRGELETKKTQLEADIEAANQLIAEMEADIDSLKELQALEEAAEAEVKAQIEELEAEYEAARAAEIAAWEAAQAAQQQQQQQQSGGSANVSGGGGATLLWPSYCTIITSYYGNRLHPEYGYYRMHKGVDIGASARTDIWAPADGIVITSAKDSGYGNYVVIRHDNGYYTLCAHMDSRAVSAGQRVSQGQTIGYVGSTGVSTGYHIHYEIWDSNMNTMNPLSVKHIYA